MRQISPVSNLLLACAAALGLIGSLALPWYAPPVKDPNVYDGPVERAAFAVSKVFAHHDGAISGSDALGGSKVLVVVLALAIVALCGLTAVPALRSNVRDVLRALALATPLLVLVLAVRHQGTGDSLNLHWGLPVAVAVAAFAASAAWHGSEVRVKRAPRGSWERRPV